MSITGSSGLSKLVKCFGAFGKCECFIKSPLPPLWKRGELPPPSLRVNLRGFLQTCLIALAIVVMFAVGMLASPVYAEIDQETIVGIWLFDEDEGNVAEDSSGNGHDGQISNAEWTDGKFGSALEFNGSGVVRVPHADDLTLQDHTICLWAKVPEITGNWQPMVVKEAGGPLRNYGLYVDLNNGAVHYGFSSGNQWKSGTASTPITDGEWHFVAQTYDLREQDFRLYIDEVIDFRRTDGSEPDVNNVELQIGGTSFVGTLDEVAIFNVALSEDVLADIRNNGIKNTLEMTAIDKNGKIATLWGQIKVRD